MAATKSSGALITAGTSNAASATTTSSTLDLSTAYGALISVVITNGGTGPSGTPTVTVNTSTDGTTFDYFAQGSIQSGASAVTSFAFEIPGPVIKANVVVTGNTSQAVTITRCVYHLLTGV